MKFIALFLTVALASLATHRHASASAYCSLNEMAPFMYGSPQRFIATATGDSVRGVFYGQIGPRTATKNDSARGPDYAQLFNVERIGATIPDSIARLIKAAGNRVLVVPWETYADCSPAPHRGEALWVETGTKGLFNVSLQPRSRWAQGIPTFYTGASVISPYPSAYQYTHLSRARFHDKLTPDDLLSLIESLPGLPPGRQDKVARAKAAQEWNRALLKWAKQNPQLTSLWPAMVWVETARQQALTIAFDTLISPVAGTWKLQITAGDEKPVTVYARTGRRPNTLIRDRSIPRDDTATVERRKPVAYYLLTALALDTASLPTDRPLRSMGYFAVSLDSTALDNKSARWKGGADVARGGSELVADTLLRRTMRESASMAFGMYYNHVIDDTPGEIVRDSRGLSFSLKLVRFNTPILSITGQRISERTLTDDQ